MSNEATIWVLGDEGFWRTPDERLQAYATIELMQKVRALRDSIGFDIPEPRAFSLPASGDLLSLGRAGILALTLARERRASNDVQRAFHDTIVQPVNPPNEDCIGREGCEANGYMGCECAPTARQPIMLTDDGDLDDVMASLDPLSRGAEVGHDMGCGCETTCDLCKRDDAALLEAQYPNAFTDSVISGAPGPQGDVDVDVAARLAWSQHRGQVRKYSGVQYLTHLENVAALVRSWGGSPTMVAASWLHDVLEDTDIGKAALRELLEDEMSKPVGYEVWRLVCEMTDVYTPESFPHLNRKMRKRLEAERIAQCSVEAQVIKAADMEDNSFDIQQHTEAAKFAPVYLDEKRYLMDLIGEKVRMWKAKR